MTNTDYLDNADAPTRSAHPAPVGPDAAAAPPGPCHDPTRPTVSEQLPGPGIDPASEPVTHHDGPGEALISPVPLPAELAELAGRALVGARPRPPRACPSGRPGRRRPGPGADATSTKPDLFDLARRRRGGGS